MDSDLIDVYIHIKRLTSTNVLGVQSEEFIFANFAVITLCIKETLQTFPGVDIAVTGLCNVNIVATVARLTAATGDFRISKEIIGTYITS